MNLDQVLTNYDENQVKELQNTLESQLEQRTHHQQPHTNFTSGNNSYYNTHSSSDNGNFTYNSNNSSNASQSRVSSNYHSSPYLLQQQHHHQNHRQEHFSHRGLEPPPSPQHHPLHYQQQQKFNGGGHLGGGYLGSSGGGVMHHQFSSHQHPNYISSEQNNNTKTYNNHINTNTNPNNSKSSNISGGDSVNRSIYHQSNNNNHNFNNYNNNNNNQDTNNKNPPNTASSNKSHISTMPTNEPVKLVYPVSGTVTPTNSNATTIVTGGQAGQAHHLPNGTISLSQMTGQQSGGATIISSQGGLVKTGGHGQGIPQTLIIKNPQGVMTSSAPGMVTMTKTMNNQVSRVLGESFFLCVVLLTTFVFLRGNLEWRTCTLFIFGKVLFNFLFSINRD